MSGKLLSCQIWNGKRLVSATDDPQWLSFNPEKVHMQRKAESIAREQGDLS